MEQQSSKRRRGEDGSAVSIGTQGSRHAPDSTSSEHTGSSGGGGSSSSSSSSSKSVRLTSPTTGRTSIVPKQCLLGSSRSVQDFVKLSNRIGEGTYGVVYRARDSRSGSVVVRCESVLSSSFSYRPLPSESPAPLPIFFFSADIFAGVEAGEDGARAWRDAGINAARNHAASCCTWSREYRHASGCRCRQRFEDGLLIDGASRAAVQPCLHALPRTYSPHTRACAK